VAEYLHLHIDHELLDSLASNYSPKAHKAAYDLLEQLRSRVTKTAEKANYRIQCQDWLVVISSTLWEYRTSLVYAEAHLNRHMQRMALPDTIPTNSSLAFDYFIENAAVRAHSAVEKTLQLLNVALRLGLAEVRKVTFDNVRKNLADTTYLKSLDRLQDTLDVVGDLRHAHVHRFDPGIARTEVVATLIEGDPVSTVNLYRLRERPLSAHQQLSTCQQAYGALDEELAALFRVISIQVHSE
jgi:hypothetical protein